MNDDRALRPTAVRGQIMSAFADIAKASERQELSAAPLGQRCPHPCPQHCPHSHHAGLGAPMTIHEVAGLLGCSAWTVRQTYLPQGLPHLRAREGGKIIFFREQVAHWILNRQEQQHEERRYRP